MTQRFVLPLQQVFTNLGIIGTGFKLKTFATGTTTPLATYSDIDLQIANANPATGATTGNQIADSAGRFGEIWVGNPNQYKVILTDSNDVIIFTADPMNGSNDGTSLINFDPIPEAFWGTTGGTSTLYTLDSNVDISQIGYSATQVFKVNFHAACGNSPTLAIDGLNALNLMKSVGGGNYSNLIDGDVQIGTYSIWNDGTRFIVLNLLPSTTSIKGLSFLPSLITVSNNNSTPNTTMDFSAGNFIFSDGSGQGNYAGGSGILNTAFGSGNGMLDTGSVANNTFYFLFMVYNPTTNIAKPLASTSFSSPTLPSGFTKKSYRGALKTDGSSNILPGTYDYDPSGSYVFSYNNPIKDFDVASPPTSSNTSQAMSLPIKTNIIGYIKGIGITGTSGADVLTVSFGAPTETLTSANFDFLNTGDTSRNTVVYKRIPTNTGAIKYSIFTSATTRELVFYTYGWEDKL